MHIVFLSKYNVQDDIFLKDLSKNFKYQKPVLLVHDTPYTKPEDTGFLTKRISAHLSESMIANIPVSGHQRSIFDGDTLKFDLLNSWWKMSGTIVLNTLKKDGSAWSHYEFLQQLKQSLPLAEIDVFTRNPLSPLGTSGERIQDAEQIQAWMEVYPEEKDVLELSLALLPVRILIPKQYTQNG